MYRITDQKIRWYESNKVKVLGLNTQSRENHVVLNEVGGFTNDVSGNRYDGERRF